ncbi:hypothetical protein JWG45_17530 [Leptospira sp. 201903070]|uniref:Uncharacterized protein n=1 Tax=Leptospira ainlahdjerensis TaxID=2810033 RepID=A0ABS2UEZ1_9LEPT|nr:hypothetical protein [Leptospira ainlahdjerensis]MBM9578950.1 hypothetical protein [Leptospira ainlahdjerensis]
MNGVLKEEFHIYKHLPPTTQTPRLWGAIGKWFDGPEGAKIAISTAALLQTSAPEGVEYSVQRYEYGIHRKNRPSKTMIWRNGRLIDA